MKQKTYVLYRHISPNGKMYIGITKRNVEDRWGENGYRYKSNKHFYNAIQKYGWDNFEHEILFNELTQYEAKLMEKLYIALHDTFHNGYNNTLGGDGISGHTLSEKTKEKLRNINLGKKASAETKHKISNSLKKAWKDPNSTFNSLQFREKRAQRTRETPMKEETKAKIKELLQERNHTFKRGKHPYSKKVICITTNKFFDCVRDAGDYYNIGYSGIVCCCKKKNKNSYSGKLNNGEKLVWMYYDEYIQSSKKDIIAKTSLANECRKGANSPKSKKIICINTSKTFHTSREAGEFYNINTYNHINDVCRGKRNYCGKLPNGTPLKWMYYEDYLKNKKEIDDSEK